MLLVQSFLENAFHCASLCEFKYTSRYFYREAVFVAEDDSSKDKVFAQLSSNLIQVMVLTLAPIVALFSVLGLHFLIKKGHRGEVEHL